MECGSLAAAFTVQTLPASKMREPLGQVQGKLGRRTPDFPRSLVPMESAAAPRKRRGPRAHSQIRKPVSNLPIQADYPPASTGAPARTPAVRDLASRPTRAFPRPRTLVPKPRARAFVRRPTSDHRGILESSSYTVRKDFRWTKRQLVLLCGSSSSATLAFLALRSRKSFTSNPRNAPITASPWIRQNLNLGTALREQALQTCGDCLERT
jgi:hypothetical protein